MIKEYASGKLYWAGEYAIIAPNNTAIIKNVNRTLSACIEKTINKGIINTGISNNPITWKYKDGKIFFSQDKEREYIYDTIFVMNEYIKALGKELICFNLSIKSNLRDENNTKYGFGSSAAIVVAIVKSMAKLYELSLSSLETFKISSIVSIIMGSNSSMGDIAASSFEGLIAYSSFDRYEIRKKLEKQSIHSLVHEDWKYLRIRKIDNKLKPRAIVGWTKTEADSSEFIDKISKINTSKEYKNFVSSSQKVVLNIIKALETNDRELFKENIKENSNLLRELGYLAGANIETEPLRRLRECSESFGEVAKLSGAGGGDCGIAFVFNDENIAKISQKWEENSIEVLGEIM